LLSLSQGKACRARFFDCRSYRWPPAGVFEFDCWASAKDKTNTEVTAPAGGQRYKKPVLAPLRTRSISWTC